MPRKTRTVTITTEGRDKGRSYLLTEMPAMQAEDWASRALTAVTQANPTIPEDVKFTGMAGVASLGIRTLSAIAWEDLKPLLAEMLTCVQFVPDPTRPNVVRPMIEDDVEEVGTLLMLRAEIIELHTGFSVAAELSKLGAAFKKVLSSSTTPTSQPASA